MHPVCLSVDVEDWFHPELVRAHVAGDDPRSVVVEGTRAILAALTRHDARATFFVLGEVARRHPALMREIRSGGHEIGCHGTTHRPLWEHDAATFRRELREFRAILAEVLGEDPAIGYRAPTFSLDRGTAWALEVLADEGFQYDSSLFPVRVGLYGVAGARLDLHRPSADLVHHDPSGAIVEFPVAVATPPFGRVPVGGGFYLRALPGGWFRAAVAGIARHRPVALYLHPWEMVPSLPRVRLPRLDAFVTYHGIAAVPDRLDRVLARFGSRPMREALATAGHLPTAPSLRRISP